MNTTEEKEKAREAALEFLKAKEVALSFLKEFEAEHFLSDEMHNATCSILEHFQEWQKSQGETFSREEVEVLLNVLSQVTRSLSRICNNPNAICGVDFSRLEQAKLALSKFSNLDVNQIPQPQIKGGSDEA